jgi:hypothetical protein
MFLPNKVFPPQTGPVDELLLSITIILPKKDSRMPAFDKLQKAEAILYLTFKDYYKGIQVAAYKLSV